MQSPLWKDQRHQDQGCFQGISTEVNKPIEEVSWKDFLVTYKDSLCLQGYFNARRYKFISCKTVQHPQHLQQIFSFKKRPGSPINDERRANTNTCQCLHSSRFCITNRQQSDNFQLLVLYTQEQSIFPAAESPSTTVLSSVTMANSAAGQSTCEWKVSSVGNESFYLTFKSEK